MKLPTFFRKAKPVRRASDRPPIDSITLNNGSKVIITFPEQIEAAKAMMHPVIHRVLTKLAVSVQSVKWYVEADNDVPEAERAGARAIKELNAVLASPNDEQTPDQLKYWLALNIAAYGRVAVKVGVGVLKTPNAIYPLKATEVSLERANGVLAGYKYGLGEKAVTYPTRKKWEVAKPSTGYVYEICTPGLDPNSETQRNNSALNSVVLPAAVIQLLLRRAIDTAAGHPNMRYVVVAEKTLSNKQKEALKEHLDNAGPDDESSGGVLLLYNTKVEIHKLDNNLSDIHSKTPMDDMTRMIAGAYGIPIAILGLGAADAAKFAGNFIESRTSFWEDTICPVYLEPIAKGLTAAICPYGAVVKFDLDTIHALQDGRVARAVKLTPVSFLTQNEKRELCGFEPTDEIITAPPAAAPLTPPADPVEEPAQTTE